MKIIKREKSTSTKGHYVTNAVLLPAVLEAKELNVVTEKLIRMINMIAERYSRKYNFVNYSFREDMVQAAVMNLVNNALKFNPEKSNNPFSFYTTAIHNSFLQYIAEEKRQRNIRDQLLLDAGSNPSFNYQERSIPESDSMTWMPVEIEEIEEPAKKKKVGGVDLPDVDCLDDETPKKREVPYRLQHREPSGEKVFKPDQLVYDAELGYFVEKPKAEKKTRSKKEA